MPVAGVRRVLPRAGLLLIPPLLLALQLLVVLRLPRSSPGDGDGIAFSVISIEPARSARHRGFLAKGPELLAEGEEEEEEEEEERAARGYQDENEMPRRQGPGRGLELQSWADGGPSFTAEVDRLIAYITTPQLNCSKVLSSGKSQASQAPGGPWLLCLEGWSRPNKNSACVAYSFSMDGSDAEFLRTVLEAGCEVHRFDPSMTTSGGHRLDMMDGSRSYRGVVQHHRAWLDWRAPKGRKQKKKGTLGSGSRTLAVIMDVLGHHTVHFLYTDLLSAEWRVLQNWAELGTLQNIHHLVATVHMQWAGFEVGGADAEVVRYWFSVIQGLHRAGFRLVHSSPGEAGNILRQKVANAHNSYTLSWINARPMLWDAHGSVY